jgi:lipid A ethanolaminephosphotransferase
MQNAAMSLKLFRSTGYSSILSAGETRVAMHPGWVILFTSVWAGFASNQALWRELSAPSGRGGLVNALAVGTFMAAAGAVVLSLLGWHKTLKPAATLVLFVTALAAATSVPLDGGSFSLSRLVLPSWGGLLHWQTWASLAVLALLPAICIYKTKVRRLPGNKQLGVNLIGAMMAGAVLALSGFLVH